MVPSPRARHVQEVPLGVVHLLQIRVVAHSLDPLLKGQNLVVACHYGDLTEFQPFCKIHRRSGHVISGRINPFVEHLELEISY